MKQPKVWHEIKVNSNTKSLHQCLKACKVNKYPTRMRHLHDFVGGNAFDVLCTDEQFKTLEKEFLK